MTMRSRELSDTTAQLAGRTYIMEALP
jgi:hypothetical protein